MNEEIQDRLFDIEPEPPAVIVIEDGIEYRYVHIREHWRKVRVKKGEL